MKSYTNEELCLIWLDSFIGLEYKHKHELYKYIDGKSGIKSLIENGKEYIIKAVGEKEYSTLVASANKSYLDYVLKNLDDRNITAVTIVSNNYPQLLSEVPCPPLVLYVKGREDILSGNNFAIVGSRKSLPLSVSIADNFTKELIDAGFIPVTGIAEGIDSAVLKAAVEKGAPVISVLGGGHDHVYPKSNFELSEEVAKVGALVSEYPPDVTPKPYHFPIRNRIIAGLAKGTLVVSGAIKSGTLYTAEYTEELGRYLFVIPYNVGVQSGAGCNELIKRGAYLTDKPSDILEFYGLEKQEKKTSFTQEEKQIINALSSGEAHVEKISASLGKRVFEIMPTLSMLEIKGVVAKSGNVYSLLINVSEA